MDIPTLEHVIRQYIALPPRPNGRGFFSVLCKVCNDHGRKGKRAGFTFENQSVGYNCFNCGHSAGYTPSTHETMPKDMITVLESFGIPQVDWEPVLFANLADRENGDVSVKPVFSSIEPKPLTFPPFFYQLNDDPNDEWAQFAIEYISSRKISWKEYPFYIVKRQVEHPDNKKWYGRLIIPVYKNNQVVFWQGRDLTGLHVQKYLSVSEPRDRIISNYDRLRQESDQPLFVTEGWFDAEHVRGIAVFGNSLIDAQIKWLNQSYRQKVIIPDRFGDGHLLAKDGLKQGWAVSLPDIGSCKDVDEAVRHYGLLYTLTTIKENIFTGFEAEVRLRLYCEQSSSKKTDKTTPRKSR